jgi:hypothetical protein
MGQVDRDPVVQNSQAERASGEGQRGQIARTGRELKEGPKRRMDASILDEGA